MKLKNKLFLGALFLASVGALASCNEINAPDPGGNTPQSSQSSAAESSSSQEESLSDILIFVDDNAIYFDNQLPSTVGVTLKIDGNTAITGNNAVTASSTVAFEGTTTSKLYVYIVGMTKNGNQETYSFTSSIGLNASTAEGMNVATRRLNTLRNGKTRVFVSVSTSENGWNQALSIKLNIYINSQLYSFS